MSPVGFYGGVTYAQSQSNGSATDNFAQQRATANQQGSQTAAGPCGFPQRSGQGNRQGRTNQGGQGGQFAQIGQCVARGSISAINGNTLQIRTPTSVVTVTVDGKTVITKTDVGALSDLKEGNRVTVFSLHPSDSPAASMIQFQRAPNQSGQ